MKPLFFAILCLATLAGCAGNTAQRAADAAAGKALSSATARKAIVFVKDSAQYDTAFINALQWEEPIKLIDSLCIIGDDTVHFPSDIEPGGATIFKGATPARSFVLTVARTNFTNLIYTIAVTDKGTNTTERLSGAAVLKPSFFLASEVDEDPDEEAAYGSTEYVGVAGGYPLTLRIGIGLDERGRKRATIYHNSPPGGTQTTALDTCPILRTE